MNTLILLSLAPGCCGIIGLYQYVQCWLGIEPRASCMLGNYPTNWAKSSDPSLSINFCPFQLCLSHEVSRIQIMFTGLHADGIDFLDLPKPQLMISRTLHCLMWKLRLPRICWSMLFFLAKLVVAAVLGHILSIHGQQQWTVAISSGSVPLDTPSRGVTWAHIGG